MILLGFIGGLVVMAIAALWLFRLYGRCFGLAKVLEDGVVLTEKGIEALGLFLFYKYRIAYREVMSVEFLKGQTYGAVIMMPRYWMAKRIPTHPLRSPVVIKLRGRFFGYQYLIATPKDGAAFTETLRQRITQEKF